MWYLIFAIFLFIVFMAGIWAVKKFKKKYNPNRWLVGFIGPLILLLPLIFFPDLPQIIWLILIVIFMWTNIYFFETSREMVESGDNKSDFKRKDK